MEKHSKHINLEIKNILDSIEDNEVNVKGLIYSNQIRAARQCILNFVTYDEKLKYDSRNRHGILLAKMQSGKTGVCNAIVNLLECKKSTLADSLKIQKYYFITGMNDVGLLEQTAKRVRNEVINSYQLVGGHEDYYGDRIVVGEKDIPVKSPSAKYFILKNSDLRKDKILLENCLIFIDEAHFGSGEDNVLTKFLNFNGINWKNDNSLLEKKNIRIVSVSATPFNEIDSDTALVKNITYLETDEKYYGITEFFNNDLVFPTSNKDFTSPKKIKTLFEDAKVEPPVIKYIKDAYERIKSKNGYKGIVIVRNKRANSIIEKDRYIKDKFNVVHFYGAFFNGLDFTKLRKDIDLMSSSSLDEYKKPLLVLIKGAFQAGITIPKKDKDLIFMVYDAASAPHSTAQGLLGRMCGYREDLEEVTNTHFYVNMNNAEMYWDWEESGFERKVTPGKQKWGYSSKLDSNIRYYRFSGKFKSKEEYILDDDLLIKFKSQFIDSISNKEFIKRFILENFNNNIYKNTDYIGECYLGKKDGYRYKDSFYNKGWINNFDRDLLPGGFMEKYLPSNERRLFEKGDYNYFIGKVFTHVVFDNERSRVLVYHGELSYKVKTKYINLEPIKVTDITNS